MTQLKTWQFNCVWLLIFFAAVFFRFYNLTSNPPSLYWEEVALGYDAYSILKTGKDFHGHAWPIVAFESFGDWKPSLYFYAIVPGMAIFGLSEVAVRLPSALAGMAIVIGVGILATSVLRDRVSSRAARVLGMAIAAVSPWAIIFSRGGWEANLATALVLWGVIFFLFFIEKNQLQLAKAFSLQREKKTVICLIAATVCLALSLYAYHSARLVVPLLGIGLLGLWWSEATKEKVGLIDKSTYFWSKNVRFILIGLGVTVCLILPLLFSLSKVETQQRFDETNIFADLQLLQKSQALQAAASDTFLARILYHRYVIYTQEVSSNFLKHFSIDFLFIEGDENVRHSVQFMGQLYHIEFFFLVLAAWQLFRRRRPLDWFLIWWLLVGILPAALTKASPHALRILLTLPVWLVLSSSGVVAIYEVLEEVGKKIRTVWPWLTQKIVAIILTTVLVSAYAVEVGLFWRFYTVIYPQVYAAAFNDGEKEMIEAVHALELEFPELPVVVMRSRGRPSVYYWFYTQTDPHEIQIANETALKDQGEFLSFKNVTFPVKVENIPSPSILAIMVENYRLLFTNELDLNDPNQIIIKDESGRPIWVVLKYRN